MKRIDVSTPKIPNIFAMVDDEDFEILLGWKWYAKKGHGTTYAVAVFSHPFQRVIPLHRFIMGAKKGSQVDHIDGNGLNNQRSNLRICNHSENQWNRGKQKKQPIWISRRSLEWARKEVDCPGSSEWRTPISWSVSNPHRGGRSKRRGGT